MTKTNRLLVIFNTLLATILVVVLIQFAPSVANAGSTTIVACADKKTGALRMAYKKCSSKENNISWGITGAKGPAGPKGSVGPQGLAGGSSAGGGLGFVLRDATGAIVENVVSVDMTPESLGEGVVVFREGALWGLFLSSGEIYPLMGGSNWYASSDCSGELVLPAGLAQANQGGFNGSYYKTSELTITGPLYQLVSGDCKPADLVAEPQRYFQMIPVAKPSDLPAPLYLRAN
jgi:hypothetical protein